MINPQYQLNHKHKNKKVHLGAGEGVMTHVNRIVLELKLSVANKIVLMSELDNKRLPYKCNLVSSLSLGKIIL